MEEKIKKVRLAAITAAIKELDPETDFTAAGKPEVKVLEQLTAFDVSADMRDEAWAAMQEEPEKTTAEKTIVTGEDGLKAIKAAREERTKEAR